MTIEQQLETLKKMRNDVCEDSEDEQALCYAIRAIEALTEPKQTCNQLATDCISRAEAIDAVIKRDANCGIDSAEVLRALPSAQPERYTKEELRVFAHGISLSLLSKRSAQHWKYDKDTATEIEFLERLYDKVSANMKGGQG